MRTRDLYALRRLALRWFFLKPTTLTDWGYFTTPKARLNKQADGQTIASLSRSNCKLMTIRLKPKTKEPILFDAIHSLFESIALAQNKPLRLKMRSDRWFRS